MWATYSGGNVEGLLLTATLLAAALVALVLLAKPFYALFFVAFGLLLPHARDNGRHTSPRVLSVVAGLVVALLVGEVVQWGPGLRADALQYLAHSLDAQWFVLPVGEQAPVSAWNRTPLQALIALGQPATAAQGVAAIVCLTALVAAAWLVRDRRLSFAPAFALAFALLYLGRPVGWTLAYLDLVVVVAAWPCLPRAGRALLLLGVLALLVSQWGALVATGLGADLPLLTLQPADHPWETWLVLPLAWALTVWGARRQSAGGERRGT